MSAARVEPVKKAHANPTHPDGIVTLDADADADAGAPTAPTAPTTASKAELLRGVQAERAERFSPFLIFPVVGLILWISIINSTLRVQERYHYESGLKLQLGAEAFDQIETIDHFWSWLTDANDNLYLKRSYANFPGGSNTFGVVLAQQRSGCDMAADTTKDATQLFDFGGIKPRQPPLGLQHGRCLEDAPSSTVVPGVTVPVELGLQSDRECLKTVDGTICRAQYHAQKFYEEKANATMAHVGYRDRKAKFLKMGRSAGGGQGGAGKP